MLESGVIAPDQWFNENWVIAAATLLGASLGAAVLLRQLTALNRKNRFDLLQYVASRMSQRFGELDNSPDEAEGGRSLIARLIVPKRRSYKTRPAQQASDRFYELRNRFRRLWADMPDKVRGAQDRRRYLQSLIPRIELVRDLPDEVRDRDLEILKPFVNTVNDVTEMIEAGLVDVRYFLGKYHLSLMREVFIAEPYIWYANLYGESGRWAMRVLRAGEIAREYNNISPIQRQPVFFRDDTDFGCIHREPSGRLLWAAQAVWFVRRMVGLNPAINNSSKRRQRRTLARIRREMARPR